VTVSPAESGVVEAANFGRINVKYYPPSTTETCFSLNETVTLNAAPNTGYKFAGWSISGETTYNGTMNPKEITMPSSTLIATNVIAHFTNDLEPITNVAEAITPGDAKALIDSSKPVAVIDVRETDNYNAGHILCAQNYPWITGEFSEEYTDFIYFRGKKRRKNSINIGNLYFRSAGLFP